MDSSRWTAVVLFVAAIISLMESAYIHSVTFLPGISTTTFVTTSTIIINGYQGDGGGWVVSLAILFIACLLGMFAAWAHD